MNKKNRVGNGSEIADYLRSNLKKRKIGDPARAAGTLGPEYWADAPWRLQPKEKNVPLTFIARDARDVEICKISIYQFTKNGEDGLWRLIKTIPGPGQILESYWSQTLLIPRPQEYEPNPNWDTPTKVIRLKVVYKGSCDERLHEQYLEILIARDPLPKPSAHQWFYGDTHYHSEYTNDFKEFGNPLEATQQAARSIGLDWLILTDHSVDLDAKNPYWNKPDPDSRWDDLGIRVKRINKNAKGRFRLIRGEEVTVKGKSLLLGNAVLHLLVFGEDLNRMVPGAFLDTSLWNDVIETLQDPPYSPNLFDYLFGKIYMLGEILTGHDIDDKIVEELRERSLQEQGALAFAAHPTFLAQGPYGKWTNEDLGYPIQGMETWNARVRKLSKVENDPFSNWEPMSESGTKREEVAINKWNEMLMARVDRDDYRCVLLAGSDAHGSFNYSVGWGLDFNCLVADDNCLGKVRTLLYLPSRVPEKVNAPTINEVMAAIKSGSCVVTDGPVLNFTVTSQGREAKLGEMLDQISGKGTLEVRISAKSSKEFGEARTVKLHCFFQGWDACRDVEIDYIPGEEKIIEDLQPLGKGYIWLETKTNNGREDFRCVTNPIWVRCNDGDQRDLKTVCD